MPNEILSLGLPEETVNVIAGYLCARIYAARSLSELVDMLDSHDVCCIVVNSSACPSPAEDVTALLGHTPLTTRIVLLYDTRADIDLGLLRSMGIKTLASPCNVDDLVEKLRR